MIRHTADHRFEHTAAILNGLTARVLLLGIAYSFTADAQEMPHMPYYDRGACPFECCMYREWVAKADVGVFKNRNEDGRVAFRLKTGEHVRAITGVVITYELGVTEILKPVEIGYLPRGEKPQLSLKPGDVVYPLHYVGEGSDIFWYQGKTYTDQIAVPDNARGEKRNPHGVKIRSRPRYIWWAQIKNRTGRIGWTRQTENFDGQDACG